MYLLAGFASTALNLFQFSLALRSSQRVSSSVEDCHLLQQDYHTTKLGRVNTTAFGAPRNYYNTLNMRMLYGFFV